MPDAELDRLVAGHLDDALDAAEAARLHQRLRGEPAARELLLAAARQATALPQLLARPERRHRRRLPLILAAAAGLVLAAGGWLLSAPPAPVLRGDAAVTVLRGGAAVAGPWLRTGDVLRTAERPAILAWIDETTRLELEPGSSCVIESDRGAKRLRLERGGLRADVAHQPAGGGLAILTPFGVVDVVGTRFTVQVGQGASQVSVDQGAVTVRSQEQAPPVQVQAGFTASLDGSRQPRASPRVQRPAVSLPASTSGTGATITVRDWLAVGGAGWEGGAGDGDVLTSAAVDEHWARLMPPSRAAPGYARFADDLVCTVTVSVDRPTDLALVLIVSRAADGLWQGNLQAERRLPVGTTTVRFPVASMRRAAGFSEELPAACMVRCFALMSWNPRTDFRVSRIEFGAGAKPSR